MPKAIFPRARFEGLVITDLDEEILVYDRDRDKAHCLNQTAALVWKYSNGERSVAEIAAAMEKKLGSPVDERIVWFALGQLENDHLLRDGVKMPRALAGITRREFVLQMGKAALVISVPVVISLTAPQSALAVSCIPNGQPCVPPAGPTNGPSASVGCCSGCCNPPNSPGRTSSGVALGICGPCP